MRIQNLLMLLVFTIILACKKDEQVPDKAILSFPAQNSACTTGTIVSSTLSSINFTWNAAANADSYDLVVKNLLTGTITTTPSATNQLTVTLLRDTPYSWYVISKTSTGSATEKSDVWKFYNSGIGVVSHPPFPADNLKPTLGQVVPYSGNSISLSWKGEDLDNDLVSYDIYFGTTSNPQTYKTNVTDMFLNSVTISYGLTYYWKVVSRDFNGNTSETGIHQFRTN